MSVNGVTNVADAASNANVAEISAGGSVSKIQNASSAALPEDTFTSSTGAGSVSAVAQNASLFQLSQVALSTTEPTGPAQAVTTIQAVAPQPTTLNAQITVPSSVGGLSSQTDASTTTSPEGQPQTLNSELLLRGLSNTDIQVIDRFASVNKNYDPTTYDNLIQEFQIQAAQQGSPANNQPAPTTTKAAGA
jgi:hypothetical protein